MLPMDPVYAAAEFAYRKERLTGHRAGEPVHHVPTARPRPRGQFRERLNRATVEAGWLVRAAAGRFWTGDATQNGPGVRARHRDHLASNRVATR